MSGPIKYGTQFARLLSSVRRPATQSMQRVGGASLETQASATEPLVTAAAGAREAMLFSVIPKMTAPCRCVGRCTCRGPPIFPGSVALVPPREPLSDVLFESAEVALASIQAEQTERRARRKELAERRQCA